MKLKNAIAWIEIIENMSATIILEIPMTNTAFEQGIRIAYLFG